MHNIFLFIRTHFYVILLYIVSIVAVCLLFPNEGKFPYEFQQGKTWAHDNLDAPFNVPILKTQKEITEEYDSLQRDFAMFYFVNPEVAEKQIKRFVEKFDERLSNGDFNFDGYRLREQIVAALELAYGRGIVQHDDNASISQNSTKRVVILRNNEKVGECLFDDILTPKLAYEFVMDVLEHEVGRDVFQFVKRLDLNNYIQANMSFDSEFTNKVKNEALSKILPYKGVIAADRRIINRGEFVNDVKYNELISLRYEFENRVGMSGGFTQIRIGQAIVIFFSFLLVFLYLLSFRPEIFCNIIRTVFLLLVIVLFVCISCVVARNDYFSLYIIPYVLIPIIICAFYDARIAIFIYSVALMQIGFIAPNGFEFVFINFVSGFVGLININSIYRRSSLFRSILMVVVTYCVVYSSIVFMQGIHLVNIDWMNYVRFTINGAMIFIIYPSIFIFEKTFGFISDITLMELSDTNQPLLRKLSETTPCTFQHSLQVANLAEEVIRKIGGNPLLVRTGALYHDIGKLNRPEYFIENQTNRNPHEGLSPEDSAQIIIEHVSSGIDIARKYHLPKHIVDFIRTHHGTTTARYFYNLQQKLHAGIYFDRSKFTYQGPVPFSKEMVALMMCDSIEAASRSIKEISHQTINELVDNIVNYQIFEDQYNDSNITYREINVAKQIIKNRLMNMYHVRIEYPKVE